MKGFLKGCKHPDQRIALKTLGGQDFFSISQLLSTVEVTKGDGKNQCGTSLDELSSVYKSEDSIGMKVP